MDGVLGTDISHWEDNPSTPQKIDFVKMKTAGAEFVIFKATQGRSLVDSVFLSSYADASNLIRGAYHFLDWSADSDRQAEHFCNKIESVKLDFPPIVDFECRTNAPSQTTATSELWSFIKYVENRTARIPIIYTSPYYWFEYGSNAAVWKKYPLWIANYKVTQPSIPAPWTDYLMWQYTDHGDGNAFGVESKEIDLNVFKGTLNDLRKFVGLPVVVPPPVSDAEKLARLWNAHPELHN
jgi:GH25 family lysozyme M1 (1,4-beta-N-acetylmuramidase)